jgi:hypothetical protein
MRKFITTICALIASGTGAAAQASNADWSTIDYIFAMPNGAVMFLHAGVRTLPAAPCQAAGLQNRWAFNASTPTGQAYLATLLTAYSLHKRIQIYGTGDCSAWGDTETVSYFIVEH